MSENKKMGVNLSGFALVIALVIGYYVWNENKKKEE
jgi:hypothetical protein